MSETQESLFHEDIYDAFRHAVKALGGAKKVGSRLWPEKPMDHAAQQLLHCLSPDRPEKLDLYQITLILREANKKGCHVAADRLAADTHYEFKPINPEEERATLQRQYIEAVRVLGELTKQIGQVDTDEPKVRAVK